MQKHWAKSHAHLQLSSIFFYEQTVLLLIQGFLFVFSVNIPCTKIQLSVSAEEEIDYSHHYLTLGMILGLLFPTSQEQKPSSILKYYLQNLNHLLGGTWAGPREECEEEGETEKML